MPEATNILNGFVLLDRSGSMNDRWDEALGAVNAYVRELGEAAVVTLATFDAVDGLMFDVIRDRVPTADWKDVTSADAAPRGQTPLYDAAARIIALAEAADSAKTVIVVMTDGHENASREVAKKDVHAAVERCKARHWQVVFLGADFDATEEAGEIGVMFDQTLRASSGRYGLSMKMVASHSRRYRDTDESIVFSDEDRKEADQ